MQPSIPKSATALIWLCLVANAAAAVAWAPWEDRLKEACTVWKMPPQKTTYRSPKVHLTPTLMVSGYLDPATPPVHAEAAAKTLPKARQVVVRNGSHSFAGMKGCIDLVIASFLESPAKPLDASCADNIKRPPLVRPD